MELNHDQIRSKEEFRAFTDAEIIPKADEFDRSEYMPREFIEKLAHQGYLGAALPAEYGGRAMDMITFGLLCEAVCRGSASVLSLITIQNAVSQTLLRWGSSSQKKWLHGISSGEVIASFALTEPDTGSDAKNIAAEAVSDGNSFVLSGRKKWITFGQIAGLFLVFARYENKTSAFLVERNTPGLDIVPIKGMLGFRASMLAELHLNRCAIPGENLVGNAGSGFFPIIISALDFGRYSIAWGCAGLAGACLEACIDYAGKRRQFGAYLKDHQLIQQMITDMIVNLKAARLLCHHAGLQKEAHHPDSLTAVMTAKYFASRAAHKAANDAVQIHGASGCSSEYPVQRYLRDAKIMEIIEGSTQINQIYISKNGYRASEIH